MEPRLEARKMVIDELRKQTRRARLGPEHAEEGTASHALLARLGKIKVKKPAEVAEEEE